MRRPLRPLPIRGPEPPAAPPAPQLLGYASPATDSRAPNRDPSSEALRLAGKFFLGGLAACAAAVGVSMVLKAALGRPVLVPSVTSASPADGLFVLAPMSVIPFLGSILIKISLEVRLDRGRLVQRHWSLAYVAGAGFACLFYALLRWQIPIAVPVIGALVVPPACSFLVVSGPKRE